MLDFDSLYREHAPAVHRFVLALSGDAAAADDVTAETFVRVWSTRDRIRHETVRAFLFTIARRLWLQGVRGRWRARPLVDEHLDRSPDPEARAASRVEWERMRRRLARLDLDDRAALLMRADALSYEEIARVLDISAGAAKVRVHRARKRLRTDMGEMR